MRLHLRKIQGKNTIFRCTDLKPYSYSTVVKQSCLFNVILKMKEKKGRLHHSGHKSEKE